MNSYIFSSESSCSISARHFQMCYKVEEFLCIDGKIDNKVNISDLTFVHAKINKDFTGNDLMLSLRYQPVCFEYFSI